MKFAMWTWYHYLYIVAPFVIVAILYFLFRKKSINTKWIVALILAIVNVAILLIRNIDIFLHIKVMDAELIPLGPCHFANIIFFIGVISRKQAWYNIAWCISLPFGFLAIIFANSLTNYSTMLAIRPMCYILGHLFLIVSILYIYVIGLTKFDKRSFKHGMGYTFIWLIVCIGTNLIYNTISKGQFGVANYMYFLKPENGTPLTILFNLGTDYPIGNTVINPIYIILLSLVGFILFFVMHFLHQLSKRRRIKQLK